MADAQSTMTRATSVSRKSTVASRNASLIKKNTGPHELRPSDILIERFTGWKHITKQLISYFEGIADIEYNTAKELTKLGGVIQVPFREGNQFLGEDGIQDIYYGIRDKTRVIADHHANLAKTVEGSIVQHLQKLRSEIKAHIKNVQQDTGKLANSVAKEREMSTKMITELARSITLLKNTPMSVTAREDPYAANQAVFRQLQRQVNEENALQKSIIIMQQNSAHFEEGIVRSIQSAWQTFDEWSGRMSAQVQDTWLSLGVQMRSLQPNSEWIAFAARSDHLLDPDTPLRNPETIDYPGKDDPSVIPVHQGILERKKRFTKTYKESFYVLTPSGYLHEHGSSDPTKHPAPELSLFLPECTLGPPSTMAAKSHKFHIEGRKVTGNQSAVPSKGLASLGMGREHAYTFRARSHEEMMEWWNDIKQLSKVYLTTSEQMDRSGIVPAAVRAAGYRSEEEDEEEEDGSSIEEEDDEYEEAADENEPHAAPALAGASTSAQKEEEAPAYTGGAASQGEVGPNGYLLEKKGESAQAGEPSQDGLNRSASSAGKEKATEAEAKEA
ncbi:Phosphatidylinositol 4,5-bisphosphate-binding protein SLM1 [Pseudozyma hubeiensis]|nr:Phosphatidylinositol 4,5-bisphosphate-binding protein SLM1 [Pseudozyma hubeiensis]